jgi:hypothetical protein
MRIDFARYVNKTVLVSIPTLFEDGTCRPFQLLGVELTGLWLQSDELTRRLEPDGAYRMASMNAIAFVPFGNIAGVLIPTGPRETPSDKGTPGKPAEDAPARRTPDKPKKRY